MNPAHDSSPLKDTLVGSVERVTFHNEDNGFAVLTVKAQGKRDLVPVVGHFASISGSEFIRAVGVWIASRTHGRGPFLPFLHLFIPPSRKIQPRFTLEAQHLVRVPPTSAHTSRLLVSAK